MFWHRKGAVVRLDRASRQKHQLLPRIAHFPAFCKGPEGGVSLFCDNVTL